MTAPITCLGFDHEHAREAAGFYAANFPDSHVGDARRAANDDPGSERGKELTAESIVLGRRLLGLNGGPAFKPNASVSFQILTEDQAQTDRYWNVIVDNGESDCGWCRDRRDVPGRSPRARGCRPWPILTMKRPDARWPP